VFDNPGPPAYIGCLWNQYSGGAFIHQGLTGRVELKSGQYDKQTKAAFHKKNLKVTIIQTGLA
jgi:hypothetical protein